ncbi:MAG: hypothetical protein U0559_18685 [Anaerolineae bacterium]
MIFVVNVLRFRHISHFDDARGTMRDLFVVRHYQQRFALLHQLPKQIEYFVRGARIEVARRFIGDDDGRIVGQRRAIATRCCCPPEIRDGIL